MHSGKVIPVHKGRLDAYLWINRDNTLGLQDSGKFGKPVTNTTGIIHKVTPMVMPIILASGSSIRANMLRNAGVEFSVMTSRVDEAGLKQTMTRENALSRDIADALAEMKARKVSAKAAGKLVIGCDQVLDFNGLMMSKPATPDQAFDQLCDLRAGSHTLFSAAVICLDQQPLWRHVGRVDLHMRASTDDYLMGYIDRNWNSIRHSVGAYLLEKEGVRLFERIDGDYFTVLGMPLLQILNYLTQQKVIAG